MSTCQRLYILCILVIDAGQYHACLKQGGRGGDEYTPKIMQRMHRSNGGVHLLSINLLCFTV